MCGIVGIFNLDEALIAGLHLFPARELQARRTAFTL